MARRPSERWRTWGGSQILSPSTGGTAQSGHLHRRFIGLTPGSRSRASSHAPVVPGRIGRPMHWLSYHSPASSGWGKRPTEEGGGGRVSGQRFRTVNIDPRPLQRALGGYAMGWLCWLDALGSTAVRVTDHFCPQGAGFLQPTMAWALSGSNMSHARWHVWRRGGAAAWRWLGLPVHFLAWWGRWHHQATAAYYGVLRGCGEGRAHLAARGRGYVVGHALPARHLARGVWGAPTIPAALLLVL